MKFYLKVWKLKNKKWNIERVNWKIRSKSKDERRQLFRWSKSGRIEKDNQN